MELVDIIIGVCEADCQMVKFNTLPNLNHIQYLACVVVSLDSDLLLCLAFPYSGQYLLLN